jgi:hypothetical protein
VADDEQGAARRDGVDDCVDRVVTGCVSERRVVDRHEVVAASWGWFAGDVGPDPVDLDTGVLHGSLGSVEGHL